MTSSSPSLRELTATVPLPGDDEAATHRWAKPRWTEIHERAKKLAEENEARRASLPSESTNEALRAIRRNYSSIPPPASTRAPRLSQRMLALAALVLLIDLVLVVGSVVARHGWPF